MHLGDGGGGNGGIVKVAKAFLHLAAQLGLHGGAGLASGKWRQAVLKGGEISGEGLAEQVGTGGKRLAQLDETRAHFLQRGGQPQTGALRVAVAPKQPGHETQGGGNAENIEHEQGVVASENADDPHKPGCVAQGGQHQIRQAEWRAAIPPERLR